MCFLLYEKTVSFGIMPELVQRVLLPLHIHKLIRIKDIQKVLALDKVLKKILSLQAMAI
jgi:hypothetical protein